MKRLLLTILVFVISTGTYSQTWSQLQTPNTRNLYGCWFDETHPDTGMAVGWYIQGGDRLPFGFFTSNGGATITAASLFQIYFYASSDVWFTNSYNGVVVGNGIIQTTNGGSTWNVVVDATATQAGILEDVMFTNTTDGYAVGQRYDFSYTKYEGMLFKTNNAGGSWSDYTVSQEVNNENSQLHAVYSTGNGVIYAGAENVLGGNTLFKSSDDGATWTSINFTQSIYALFFVSADTGFAATGNGLYKTTDAGNSWSNVLTATGALHTVKIKNGFGFTAGQYGIIYVTTDNGNTWTSMASLVMTTLSDVSVISPNLAYAVGAGGTFLKYTNTVSIENHFQPDDFLCYFNSGKQLILSFKNDLASISSIELIDAKGNMIKEIVPEKKSKGQFQVQTDISTFSQGVYIVRVVIGNEVINKKVVLTE